MNADAVVHSFNIFVDPKQTPAYARVAEPFKSIDHTVTPPPAARPDVGSKAV